MREGAPVRETGCPGQDASVEFRGDGDGGWEMVIQAGGELQILPVLSADPAAGGLSLKIGAPTPDAPPATIALTWVEEGRIATLSAPLDGRTYVAPSKRETVPTAPCGG